MDAHPVAEGTEDEADRERLAFEPVALASGRAERDARQFSVEATA